MSFIALLGCTSCADGLDANRALPALDEAFYRCQVQPIVTKSCSTFVCHGDATRYYKVFARNRLRFGVSEEQRNATMSATERRFDFDAARAQVDLADPAASLFVQKPLDEIAGGYFHGGATEYDRGDVYLTRDDPDFQTLVDWTLGATDDPACVEPGSNL